MTSFGYAMCAHVVCTASTVFMLIRIHVDTLASLPFDPLSFFRSQGEACTNPAGTLQKGAWSRREKMPAASGAERSQSFSRRSVFWLTVRRAKNLGIPGRKI